MIKANLAIGVMNDDDLLACTRELVRNSCEMEAELLLHLAEIDERKLYAQRAYPSMHVFCVKELGFSDGAAYNRLRVARAGRRWAPVLDALRSGAVHLSGLRVLVPHFTDENVQRLLTEATGRSKREIEEMAARLSPKATVPDRVWRLPQRSTQSLFEPVARTQSSADPTASPGPSVPVSRQQEHRSIVTPLGEDIFEVRFTASRALRDKLRKAQDLLRHRTPSGALAVVFDNALDALIVNLKKERFAVGRKPQNPAAPAESTSWSRNIPDAIKRAVYERAQGCCEFVGDGAGAARREGSSSITSRASRERTCTRWRESDFSVTYTICSRPSRCTVAPSWTACAESAKKPPPLPGHLGASRSFAAGRAGSRPSSEMRVSTATWRKGGKPSSWRADLADGAPPIAGGLGRAARM